MKATIHQPQFLPWLGYLDKIAQSDLFVVLDNVQFKKNEWQNRNRIRTAERWQWITVPVLHDFGQSIGDVRINNDVHWRQQHLRAIEIHYARAPFRQIGLDALTSVYAQPWARLADLNLAVLRWLLSVFGIETPIRLASEMVLRTQPTDRLIDICRLLHADTYLAGAGADAYMDRPRFEASGIRLETQMFHHPVYRQCYDPFLPGMSAIDLMMTEGPDAFHRLRAQSAETGLLEGRSA
ncbi:hypothetical protein YTPLAS18_21880 [Nitrospira sp.]|nr:hypothetical protein YTPLAS18_21880 [Nitrospira sp.]